MDSSVYANKDFIKASKRWVCVYGSKDSGHGTEKVNGAEMCKLHPQLTCDDHMKVNGEVSGKFFTGTIKMPATVWCDSDGKEVGKQQGALSSKQLIEKMAEVEKQLGPGLGSDEYWMAQDRLAAGEKAMGEAKLRDALASFNEVVKMEKLPGSKAVVDRAKAGLERTNEMVQALVANADEIRSAGDLDRAKEKYKEILAQFRGTEIGKKAEKALAEMEQAEKDKVKKGNPPKR
ncbi:MAG: hypothetical protein HYY18_19370 [Planctomycetes bacterium]|nr:hypothetical protein [Planctomycetota bacterium]